MIGLPARDEAAPYYFTYIDRISSPDVIEVLESQLDETNRLFQEISEEKSLYRYAPEKWSIRQVVNHVNDTERLFVFRALWFGRGLDSPLPGFDEKIAAGTAGADGVSWASHVEELRQIRLATVPFFRNLPADAWMRSGIASGYPFTVRAIAYIVAGHLAHHLAVLRERYL